MASIPSKRIAVGGAAVAQQERLLFYYYLGRCAQIPAIFENLIPQPEEKKDIFTDTPIFDD